MAGMANRLVAAVKRLLRRLLKLRGYAQGGSIRPYRPRAGERLVMLSPGGRRERQ